MFKIKEDLSAYCQQVLLLVDIFFFKALELKSKANKIKVLNNLKRQYQHFLKEQNHKFMDYELQHKEQREVMEKTAKEPNAAEVVEGNEKKREEAGATGVEQTTPSNKIVEKIASAFFPVKGMNTSG